METYAGNELHKTPCIDCCFESVDISQACQGIASNLKKKVKVFAVEGGATEDMKRTFIIVSASQISYCN